MRPVNEISGEDTSPQKVKRICITDFVYRPHIEACGAYALTQTSHTGPVKQQDNHDATTTSKPTWSGEGTVGIAS